MAGGPAAPPVADAARRALLRGAGTVTTLGLGTAMLLACGSCAVSDYRGADAPQPAPLLPPPRLAWVFGSGGPRGFVHVGVIKALAELQLEPEVIVGASVGALVGALYAAGMAAPRIEQQALALQPWQLLRWQPGGDRHWSADGLTRWVNEAVDDRPLQALAIPMVCAVQRLRDGAVLGFTRGNTGLAVQAASAIEGRLAPLHIDGEAYADADLRMPLPVRLARALGATRVLAVDASAHEDHAPAGAQRYREGDLHKRALTQPDAALADLLLHPDFGYWVSLSQDFRERAIAAGYRATLAQALQLRALHRR